MTGVSPKAAAVSQTPIPGRDGDPHGFTVTADLAGGCISLAGRLSRRNSYHLLDAVRAMSTTGHSRWAIETAGLCSCDASGLRALGACYRTALRQGAQLTVVDAAPWLQAALRTVRLDSHLMSTRHSISRTADGA